MNNLVEIYDKEPRVSTFELWKPFGYGEHRALKQLINKNRLSYEAHGEIISDRASTKERQAGRPDTGYLLNFGQTLVLLTSMGNRTSNKTAKEEIINKIIDGREKEGLLNIIDTIKNLDVEDLPIDRYIYVAKEELSGRYKIGISKDPDNRIKQLNTGNPEQLILIHTYLATEQRNISETLAHSIFNEDRLKGEWFKKNINLNLLPSYKTGEK